MRILAANMLGHYQRDRKKKGGQQQGETTGNDSGGEDTTSSEAGPSKASKPVHQLL